MNIQPIGDRIVVYPLPEHGLGSSIIVAPETIEKPVRWGKIVALGPKVKNSPLKVGHVVLFESYAGQEKTLNIEGHEVRLILESEIIAFE